MRGKIRIEFEVELDVTSEVARKARELVIEGLELKLKTANPEEKALIEAMFWDAYKP